ncbi:MAG: DUF2793 domain-containing protein [Planctomycetota bacterium]|jgi:hypothetical protein
MTELYPTDAELNDLSGTADSEQEVLFIATGESPYYTSFYKTLYRLLDVSRRAGDLRVYKDGDLTCGVRAGKFFDGDAERNYSGATAQSLTNNATNYVYLKADGTLVVNTTGFPVPSVTAHIPLATIVTAAGTYAHSDITDYRGRAFLNVCRGGQTLNMLDWQESVADELDFTTSEPGSPSIGDRYLNTATGTSSGTGQSVTADYIYEWNGTNWTDVTPTEGACCLVEDRDMLIAYNGSAWVDIGTFALLSEAQAFFNATDISGSEAETLTDGSNADSLHVHGVNGLETAVAGAGLTGGGGSALAVNPDDSTLEVSGDTLQEKDGGTTAVKLASAVQDVIPNLNLTGADDGDGTGSCTIQARDVANNNLSERFLVRTWIADAEFSEPDPQTGFSVTTGEQMRQLEANADYEVISDANGQAVTDINAGGAKTVYVMAEIDGRIYSSGAINITSP